MSMAKQVINSLKNALSLQKPFSEQYLTWIP